MDKLLCAVAALVFSLGVQADVQFTVKDGGGRSSTISSNGSLARIDDGRQPGYVILDYRLKRMSMVDPERGKIMVKDLSNGEATALQDGVALKLERVGDGPVIAGYPTRKFRMHADGQDCGTVYASRKLMQNSGVQAMFESMRSVQAMARRMAASVGNMLSTCQRANMQLTDVIAAHGAPMRVLDAGGGPVSEILEVDTDVRLPASHYELPADLAQVDMDQQLDQALQQTRQMMENMPDMNQIMEQMQSGDGEMSEAMQQQMEKLQNMMKQLQQQQQQ